MIFGSILAVIGLLWASVYVGVNTHKVIKMETRAENVWLHLWWLLMNVVSLAAIFSAIIMILIK